MEPSTEKPVLHVEPDRFLPVEHPGVILKRHLDAYKVSISYAARYLGYSRSQLHRVIRGECAMSTRLAGALEGKYGGNQQWWLDLQKAYDQDQFHQTVKRNRQ